MDLDWAGKDPTMADRFYQQLGIHMNMEKRLAGKLRRKRFFKEFATDSSAFILNESAVKFMGLKNPVGKRLNGVQTTL